MPFLVRCVIYLPTSRFTGRHRFFDRGRVCMPRARIPRCAHGYGGYGAPCIILKIEEWSELWHFKCMDWMACDRV